MRSVSVAVTQMSCGPDRMANIDRAARLVETAAKQGAQVIVLQELFETPYFCIEVDKRHHAEAMPVDRNPAVAAMQHPQHLDDGVVRFRAGVGVVDLAAWEWRNLDQLFRQSDGRVRDTTGSYDGMLFVAAGLFIVGATLLLGLGRYPDLKATQPQPAE